MLLDIAETSPSEARVGDEQAEPDGKERDGRPEHGRQSFATVIASFLIALRRARPAASPPGRCLSDLSRQTLLPATQPMSQRIVNLGRHMGTSSCNATTSGRQRIRIAVVVDSEAVNNHYEYRPKPRDFNTQITLPCKVFRPAASRFCLDRRLSATHSIWVTGDQRRSWTGIASAALAARIARQAEIDPRSCFRTATSQLPTTIPELISIRPGNGERGSSARTFASLGPAPRDRRPERRVPPGRLRDARPSRQGGVAPSSGGGDARSSRPDCHRMTNWLISIRNRPRPGSTGAVSSSTPPVPFRFAKRPVAEATSNR